MSEGVLSQEEIDALLNSDSLVPGTVGAKEQPTAGLQPVSQAEDADGRGLTEMEKDAVGEVANIVMGSAATALSTLLGRKVEITTPVVQLTDPDRFRHDYPLPYLLVNVEYVIGLSGSNVLIIKDRDAEVMVDLMMGGGGQSPPENLEEMHLSAISEAMNQMMGAAATAMSAIIKERVEISPPAVEMVDFATEELKGGVGVKGQTLVKVSFRMNIEGLLDSEIMQLVPLNFAQSMVKNLMEEMADSAVEPPVADPGTADMGMVMPGMQDIMIDAPIYEGPQPVNAGPARPVQGGSGVTVQPVQFAPLQPNLQSTEITNIDLIMDVPLQITVELGKTRKTIREVLNLGPGSVVELDKLAGEPVDLLVNGKLLAKGEVVVIDENFGIRITDIISPIERVTNLQ